MYQDELIAKAIELEIISESELNLMRRTNLLALANQGEAFTGGLSTSLLVERMHLLFSHQRFVIDVYLKNLRDDKLAIRALMAEKEIEVLNQHYALGMAHISNYIIGAKMLHQKALSTMIQIPHYTYHETLSTAIRGFFKCYIPNFESHLIYITADYPLMDPSVKYGGENDSYLGIIFIYKYLEGFYLENMFCSYFELQEVEGLLRAYNESYAEEVFNFTSKVFIQVLGLVLLKREIRPHMSLKLSRVDLEALYFIMHEGSISGKIDNAFDAIIRQMNLDQTLSRYLSRCLLGVKCEILNAMEHDLLNLCWTVYT